MEPVLTSFAIGIATNAAVAAVIELKKQNEGLTEKHAAELLNQDEMFVEFEHLLKPHIDSVLSKFEVGKGLHDFLLGDTASEEISHEIRRQAVANEWSLEALVSALSLPDEIGFLPELKQFLGGLIQAVQRFIAKDQARWNEAIGRAISRILDGIAELKDGQARIEATSSASLDILQNLDKSPKTVYLTVNNTQTNVLSAPLKPEFLADELTTEKERKLDEIRDLMRRGNTVDAELGLRELKNAGSWTLLPVNVKVRALRMHATLALNVRNDVGLAESLLKEAGDLDPSAASAFHEALLLLTTGEFEKALAKVKIPSTQNEWHLRAAILLNLNQPKEAISLLSNSAFETNAETLRLNAIARLLLKEPTLAKHEISKAVKLSPDWFSVQETAAKINYYTAIAVNSPDWGVLETPSPTRNEYVKVDPESQQALKNAEAIVDRLKSSKGIPSRECAQLNVWKLACKFNILETQADARALCTSILKDDPLSLPVIGWAIEKRVEIDVRSLQQILEDAISTTPDISSVQALFAVLCSQQLYREASKLLDKHRELYEGLTPTSAWECQRIQIAVLADEPDVKNSLLGADTTGKLKSLAARTQGMMEGWSQKALIAVDRAFQGSRRPEDLLASCTAHWSAGEYQYVVNHADDLITAFPTESILRLVLDSAFQSQNAKLCYALTEKHLGLLPKRRFSSEMRRLRFRCLYSLGRFSSARDELRQVQAEEIVTEDRFHLFDTQLKSGDPSAAAVIAKDLLHAPDMSADGLIHIADRIRADDFHLAKRAFRRAREIGINNPKTAARALEVGFKLGEDHDLKDVFRLATEGIGKPGALIQSVTLQELLEMGRENQRAEAVNEEAYRKGRIPIHVLVSPKEHLLPLLYWQTSQDFWSSNPGARRQWPLRVRHGTCRKSRIRNQTPPTGGIFLDITSLLLLHGLHLFSAVEQCIGHIHISSSALAYLDEAISKIAGYQVSRVAAKKLAISLAGMDRITIVSAKSDKANKASLVENQMGERWATLAKQATDNGGLIVDFLPVKQPGEEGKVAKLPEEIDKLTCNASAIAKALQRAGKLSSQALDLK